MSPKQEHEEADVYLNRQRFKDAVDDLRRGQHCGGTCPGHAGHASALILLTNAVEATMTDVRNLRVELAEFRAEIHDALSSTSAVAVREIQSEAVITQIAESLRKMGMFTAASGGYASTFRLLLIAVCFACVPVSIWLWKG